MTDRSEAPQSRGVQASMSAATTSAAGATPVAPESDALVRACEALAEGDEAARDRAFEAIYHPHFDYVWRSLRRFGVRERDLEDLSHDVFVIAYRNLHRFDAQRPVKPWLYGIAFRVASDYRRKASFSREIAAAEREYEDDRPLPIDHLEAKERRELVHEALEALSLDQRAVFVAHELEGLSIPEIADGLDVPDNTLYSRLRLGRKRFSAAIRRILLRRGER